MYEILPQINDFSEIPKTLLQQSQQVPPQFLKAAIFAGGTVSYLSLFLCFILCFSLFFFNLLFSIMK